MTISNTKNTKIPIKKTHKSVYKNKSILKHKKSTMSRKIYTKTKKKMILSKSFISNTKKISTKKNNINIMYPNVHIMHKNVSIFTAKYLTELDYLELINKIKKTITCSLMTIVWFSDIDVVNKTYKDKNNYLYEFKFNRDTPLLSITDNNYNIFKYLFLNEHVNLKPLIDTSVFKIKYNHPYINMSSKEQAYYEFCFAFGYLTIKEQYEFIQLVKFVIKNNIVNIKSRNNKSILNKLQLKHIYYNLMIFNNKNKKYNRLSLYMFDKNIVSNICKLINYNKYNIIGLYYPNISSFWFVNTNLTEYILFDKYKNLDYVKLH